MQIYDGVCEASNGVILSGDVVIIHPITHVDWDPHSYSYRDRPPRPHQPRDPRSAATREAPLIIICHPMTQEKKTVSSQQGTLQGAPKRVISAEASAHETLNGRGNKKTWKERNKKLICGVRLENLPRFQISASP